MLFRSLIKITSMEFDKFPFSVIHGGQNGVLWYRLALYDESFIRTSRAILEWSIINHLVIVHCAWVIYVSIILIYHFPPFLGTKNGALVTPILRHFGINGRKLHTIAKNKFFVFLTCFQALEASYLVPCKMCNFGSTILFGLLRLAGAFFMQ